MPNYRFRHICSASALALAATLSCAPAFAQDSGRGDDAAHGADAAEDAEIIVTALRQPVAVDRVASSVTILDEAEIEREQPIAISDALVRTPGISMTRNGGYGAATSLKIRGASTEQTVLVIDGMRLSDPASTGGGYNFANLLTGDAARIEILRGPQSILWGSDAIGGVVNIVTRRPEKALEGDFDIEAGSRETVNARAGIGGSSNLVDWRLAASRFTTEGISAKAEGTEKDGYRRSGASGSIDVHLAENITLDLRGYYADARNEFDGSAGDTPAYGETEEYTVYAGLRFDLLGGRFTNRVAILDSATDRQNYDPSRAVRSLSFDAKGDTRRYEYQGRLTLRPGWDISFGAEREEQDIESGSPGDNAQPYPIIDNDAAINSLYAQLRVTPVKPLTLSAGARYDDHSRFGDNVVFSAGAVFAPWDGNTVLRASYDEGFKAPSLYQLFSQYGSAALQPEKADGWEAGIEQALLDRRVRLSATYFERNTDNLIDFAYCPSTTPLPAECFIPGTATERFGYYANVNQSRARGIELSGAARFGGVFVSGNYSWIESEDASGGATDGMQLARVPKHLANARIGYETGFGLSVDVAVRYSGESFDRLSSTAAVLDDYWLTDIRAEYDITPEFSLYGRVENVFDEDYETAGGYGTLGRSVYLGIRGSF
ncbi:TonB-dependent receptor [Stakelama tenebrarum]|uniref:TonB-dependent receptor n=1 Tax=Stakelama tenebrarum TaxID=2711215 RepID=A0A6G6Y289_9SPHN|nr:TonB-dependent receptor [Sphingosinithalassobacter tenebrarum]QIG79064.1 TonB-dependent receptor [Sphingosinithalassobacter tenebrarum]